MGWNDPHCGGQRSRGERLGGGARVRLATVPQTRLRLLRALCQGWIARRGVLQDGKEVPPSRRQRTVCAPQPAGEFKKGCVEMLLLRRFERRCPEPREQLGHCLHRADAYA